MAIFDAHVPVTGHPPVRIVGAAWSTAALHLGIALMIVFVIGPTRATRDSSHASTTPLQFIWRVAPGDPGGRDRGGPRDSEPVSRIRRPGTDRDTLPARTAASDTKKPDQERPPEEIDVPMLPQASALREMIGAVTTAAVVVPSRGTGADGPGGDRIGTGSGLDRGRGTSSGDGPGRGSGINGPQLLIQVRPNYTPGALQARIRGIVTMEAVVEADGSIGDVRILRSLDRTFGLDEEAIKAVKRWRFRPGTKFGKAIPMVVTVEMTFELR